MTFEMVLIAMVAAFLGLRLYAVLGKRTGHEQEPVLRPVEERRVAPVAPRAVGEQPAEPSPAPAVGRDAQGGVQAIVAADRSFDITRFVDGASRAYRMVLEAYWKGDREELSYLCDADVLAEFEAGIAAREASGEVHDNRLIRIEDARIVDAELDRGIARITMRFDADVAAVVRDKDGNVVGGSLTDAVESHDIWTFARDIRARDPDWKLVETDEA